MVIADFEMGIVDDTPDDPTASDLAAGILGSDDVTVLVIVKSSYSVSGEVDGATRFHYHQDGYVI